MSNPSYKPLVLLLTDGRWDRATEILLNSFDANVGSVADLVVPGNACDPLRNVVLSMGGIVHMGNMAFVQHPHLWAADYLNRFEVRRHPDRPVLVLEAGYTLFQSPDLFRCCTTNAVSVLVEPWPVDTDMWNRSNFEDLNASLRPGLRYERLDFVHIVSSVVAAGPARLVAMWELARAAIDARVGPGTTQSATTLLGDWAQSWPWFVPVPVTDPWVAHGHWAAKVDIPVADGVAVCQRTGEPYTLFHDWHRVSTAVAAVERKYLQ